MSHRPCKLYGEVNREDVNDFLQGLVWERPKTWIGFEVSSNNRDAKVLRMIYRRISKAYQQIHSEEFMPRTLRGGTINGALTIVTLLKLLWRWCTCVLALREAVHCGTPHLSGSKNGSVALSSSFLL